MSKRLAVYTVVLGDGYRLPKTFPDSGADYICFTDRFDLDPRGWLLQAVDPLLPSDMTRSSREQKIRPHRWLADYDRSLYIDPSVLLTKPPTALWDHLIDRDEVVFGGFYHSFCDSLEQEFATVSQGGLDANLVIQQQYAAYEASARPLLSKRPTWGGILARRHHDPACKEAMEIWFANVLRYSRRDQLSLPLALSGLRDEQLRQADENNHKTAFHMWPAPDYIRPARYNDDIKDSKPLISKVRGKLKRYLRKHSHTRRLLKDDVSRVSATRDVFVKGGRVAFGLDAKHDLFFARDVNTGKKVYVSDRMRLELYRQGAPYRQSCLLQDYCLPVDLIEAGDRVIDIGANIGELGMWVTAAGGDYIAFEPDPKAFQALNNNVNDAQAYNVALSDTGGSAEFYLSTPEADSSLVRPKGMVEKLTVQRIRLDDFMKGFSDWERIKLVKIKAAGMEPEVVSGALETLTRADYIAVDAGPRRGGKNTAPEVLNMLRPLGFEIVACFLQRGTFFLRNQVAL